MGIFGAGGLVVVAAGLFAYHKKTKAQQEKKPDDYDETDYYDVRPMTFIQMSMIYNNINVGEYTKAISLDPESKRAAFARARMETSENVKLRVKLQLAQKKLENERTANLNSRILMVNGSFPLNQMEVNVFRKFLGRRVTLKNVEELPKEKLALEAGKKAEDDFMAEVMKAENSGKVFADQAVLKAEGAASDIIDRFVFVWSNAKQEFEKEAIKAQEKVKKAAIEAKEAAEGKLHEGEEKVKLLEEQMVADQLCGLPKPLDRADIENQLAQGEEKAIDEFGNHL